MTRAQRALDDGHERVEGYVEKRVAQLVVGHFQGEALTVGVVCKRGQRLIFVSHAHAAPELLRSVFGTEHVDVARHVARLAVEQVLQVAAEAVEAVPTAAGSIGQTRHAARQHVPVDVVMAVVVVVGVYAIFIDKVQRHSRHATHRQRFAALCQEVALALLAEPLPRQVDGRQIHRVAPDQMLRLDGGQHGVHPAERTMPLLLHGCCRQPHLVHEHSRVARCRRPAGGLLLPLRPAARSHHQQREHYGPRHPLRPCH